MKPPERFYYLSDWGVIDLAKVAGISHSRSVATSRCGASEFTLVLAGAEVKIDGWLTEERRQEIVHAWIAYTESKDGNVSST